MKTKEIRQKFIDYFASKGHQPLASSPLVPGNDPTLLFTNAGMVQFKEVFLGTEKRPYLRAVTSQRCVRAGGKHNDLENVGYTARHHTFFEMLGNFSFGDYFKRDAIKFAWELLTVHYGLPAEKLWTTVYATDDEAFDIWTNEIGVPKDRCVRIGDKPGGRKYESDNFWQMADTGPCGPCSEIFYDHGPGVEGGPPGSPDAEGDRYIEIWNLVFMQFNRDEAGTMHPLPKPSVDTGMGLERLTAVLQHVTSNYEIDLFQSLVKAAARETNTKDLTSASLRVIADHIRACAFLVCDGVIPGNEGRGYVLRRIARRAMRHGYKLGQKKPFFYKIVADLVAEMGEAFPELKREQARVTATLEQEEKRFGETLENGMAMLDTALAGNAKRLDGETAFKLYDTYGFPVDLTADIGRERGFDIDMEAFDKAMSAQQERSRAASKFKGGTQLDYKGAKTAFKGYESLSEEGRVVALYKEGSVVDRLEAGDTGIVVLDKTPFYAESGGQVGDRGELSKGGTCLTLFDVQDTQKIQPDVFGHYGTVKTGELKVGDAVAAQVDMDKRSRTVRHHSATHLMHKALREVLGTHVQQKGSLVDEDKTRFDFSHNAPMTGEQIRRVETIVNSEILKNESTNARVMPIDDAQKLGAMMLFGEKYGDEVRVLDIGSSRELCGGTHVARTGDIGPFRIVAEGGVAAGVRRVEAITGTVALAYGAQESQRLARVADALKAQPQEVEAKLAQVMETVKALEKEVARLKGKMAASQGDDLAGSAIEVKGAKILAAKLEGADVKTLRDTLDQLKNKLGSSAIVLAAADGDKVSLIAGVSADLTGKVKAGELVNFVATQVGGKGGGRPDMAQAGGTNAAGLPAALESVKGWVEQRL
ncbi:alanine--tRNA ligase [Usitatibacter palustris]|uniref:Alanine--tRNA ligase n=1 Tax=Usitatibacter palustris TaxID=2732487 RepID=A0A6M4H6I7_9PROT|nr:alanine--tRNA ligase [Usitatibacter palustris]QJR14558.1 Alanine--tRNA ligase [Usitatibacter palustris]